MKLERSVAAAFDSAESALASGGGLEGTGFWKAVGSLRRHPELAAKFAARAARIDRRAFEARVRLRVPAPVGTAVLAAATFAGIALVFYAASVARQPVRSAFLLAGTLTLLLSTHSLAHWAVGRLLGIRFTHYFVASIPPRPGAKADYESYLRAPPGRRAVMHASGAVVTKAIPFLMLPVARAIDVAPWATYGLAAVGALQIVTDLLFSTKSSDWKKVRRELAAARSIEAPKGNR